MTISQTFNQNLGEPSNPNPIKTDLAAIINWINSITDSSTLTQSQMSQYIDDLTEHMNNFTDAHDINNKANLVDLNNHILNSTTVHGLSTIIANIDTNIYQIGVNVIKKGATGLGLVSDAAAIYSAITDASTGNYSTIYFPAGTYKISSNLTFPSDVTVKFANRAILSVDSGITVTINGVIDAGLYQIFSGSGTITGAPKIECVYPEWWGAVGNYDTSSVSPYEMLTTTHDDTEAIQLTFDFGYPIKFTKKKYYITSSINVSKQTHILGLGGSVNSNTASDIDAVYPVFYNDSTGAAFSFVGTDDDDYLSRVRQIHLDGLYIINLKSTGIGLYFKYFGEITGRNVIIDGGDIGLKMEDGSEATFDNLEIHNCVNPIYLASTGSTHSNQDFAAITINGITISSYTGDGVVITDCRNANISGVIAHNGTDASKYAVKITVSGYVTGSDGNAYECILGHTAAADNKPVTGANWETYWQLGTKDYILSADWVSGTSYTTTGGYTDRTNSQINLNILTENTHSAPVICIGKAGTVNLNECYLSGNTNPKVFVDYCQILNVNSCKIDNVDTTESFNHWLEILSTCPDRFILNINNQGSSYNSQDIAILDRRTKVLPLLNYGNPVLDYSDMSRCGASVTCSAEPTIDDASFVTGYNSLRWASGSNVYAYANIDNLNTLNIGDVVYVETIGTENLIIKFMQSATYIEPDYSYYTVQTLTANGKTLVRKFARIMLAKKLNRILVINESPYTDECILDYFQVYCERKLKTTNVFGYGLSPESSSDLRGTFLRGEKFYSLDYGMSYQVSSPGSYGSTSAKATGIAGHSDFEISDDSTPSDLHIGSYVTIAGDATVYYIGDIVGITASITPSLALSPVSAAISFSAPTWQFISNSPKDMVKTLTPIPSATIDTYGTIVYGYSTTGYRGVYPVRIKITFDGTFVGGENVTVQLGTTHWIGSTKTVDIIGTSAGDVWLTDAEMIGLLYTGYLTTSVSAKAKSSVASTTVTTSVVFYGLYI